MFYRIRVQHEPLVQPPKNRTKFLSLVYPEFFSKLNHFQLKTSTHTQNAPLLFPMLSVLLPRGIWSIKTFNGSTKNFKDSQRTLAGRRLAVSLNRCPNTCTCGLSSLSKMPHNASPPGYLLPQFQQTRIRTLGAAFVFQGQDNCGIITTK